MQRSKARVISKDEVKRHNFRLMMVVAAVIGLLLASLPAFAAGTSSSSSSDNSNAYSGATKNLSATMRTATKLIKSGDFEAALPLLLAETKADPKNADVWNLTGFASRKLGQLDQSAAAYETALSLDPKHKGALEYQGELFLTLGELAKAEANLALLDQYCSWNCSERKALRKAVIAYKKAQ